MDTKSKDWLIIDSRQVVGNCLLFWGPDRRGYVCELGQAGRYTEEEARRQERSRPTDRAVPFDVVMNYASTHVRTDTGLQAELARLAVLDSGGVAPVVG